ncbi:MAG: selenide, water dikinase SelD [Nitriliruptoraceae bacterium]
MLHDATTPRLTSLSHGAGCACKLSLDELQGILAGVSWPTHDDLLVGLASGDDAAVWRQPDGRVLVATTDFFTPLVDDPRDWGRIAATNAVSDVYAMGATPRFALNLVGWPRDLDFDVLRRVLDGAVEVAGEAGYVIAGGHSIDSVEPLFGQVVIGDAAEVDLLTNAGATPGQSIVLTKPIGTGVVTTALKRSEPLTAGTDGPLPTAYRAAVGEMTRLNGEAARVAVEQGATAATDVTGFGLLGHLHRLASASGVGVSLEAVHVPLLPHVEELIADGFVPGGSQRNADQAVRFLVDPLRDDRRILLADAQTSGGLVFTLAPAEAEQAVRMLRDSGHDAAIIGATTDGDTGMIGVVEP